MYFLCLDTLAYLKESLSILEDEFNKKKIKLQQKHGACAMNRTMNQTRAVMLELKSTLGNHKLNIQNIKNITKKLFEISKKDREETLHQIKHGTAKMKNKSEHLVRLEELINVTISLMSQLSEVKKLFFLYLLGTLVECIIFRRHPSLVLMAKALSSH